MLYGDKLLFVLSFVASNNSDVETAEQFILLYTRYVCDFSGLTKFSQKLWKLEEDWRKHLYRTLLFSRRFLAFDPRWILDSFRWEKFRLNSLSAYSKGKLSDSSSGKIVFFSDRLFACCWLLRKLWTSSFVRSVDFLSLLSEWVGDWSNSHRQFAWMVKFALRMFQKC